jgi:diguanylate cyclase (GGDEF)-like protein
MRTPADRRPAPTGPEDSRDSAVIRAVRALVVLVALAAVAGGILLGRRSAAGVDFLRLGVAVAVTAIALIARVRVRVSGGRYVSLAWGEAALIVVLFLVPAGWVPLAMLVGAGIAMLVLQSFDESRTPMAMLFNAASLTVAGTAATVVAQLVRPPHLVAFGPRVATALVLAAVVYSLVGMVLLAGSLGVTSGTDLLRLVGSTLAGKIYMIVGNVTVGLIVIVMLDADPRWLLALPPVLWLLRQAYGYRMRADGERHGWRLFATATQALNRLDEYDAVCAAIPGAARLFFADTVEVTIRRPDGSLQQYHGGADGPVQPGPVAVLTTPGDPNATGPDADRVASRILLVGEAEVGELRLIFARPVRLTKREGMQLSAFCDALAAALHDAAAHQQLQALSARSDHEALHDVLTAIGNRTAMQSLGRAALARLRPEAPVALLLLDIDRFKEVNDTLGHAAGDDLLRVTAERLGAACRPGELVARMGGDEFALLLTVLPVADGDEAGATRFAELRGRQLADLLAAPTQVAGVRLAVEASVGVAVALAGGCDVSELLRRAEMAMYQAKGATGGIACYDSAGDASSTDRLALLADLREALGAPNQLVLALQPVIDLATGWPTGVEALVRWQHPRRGELMPAEFIDVVENSELVTPFSAYVIDRALALAAQWAGQGLTLPVSVNLSPRALLDPGLPAIIDELLHRHEVPANRLILEITETVVVPESRAVTTVLAGLRSLGVQLAVDDFGTGYSSLTFLTRVRVDEVKVDRSFVAKMADSAEATAIVRTIVELARQLHLRVVAEGVETAEQRQALAKLGCDSAQGYHFFRPMPAEKITGVLHQLIRSSGGRIIPFRQEGAS